MARKREYPRNFYLSWVGKDDLDALEPRPPKCEHGQFEEGDSPWWPPGTPWVRPPGTTERLVNLGPTLTALFHPKSWFCNFLLRWPKPDEPDQLDRVFLLHLPGDDVNKLREAIHKIARYRLSKNSGLSKKEQDALKSVLPEENENSKLLQFVPIDAHLTQHKEIAEGIRRWLKNDKPLELHRAQKDKKVFINLSPGTPAMHATWLMVYWNRQLLGHADRDILVKFFEGDGGPVKDNEARYPAEEQREPIVWLDFEPFRLVPKEKTVEGPPEELELNQLESEPYDSLHRRLEDAARLRIPVVLVGERGTGKTMLARFYHKVSHHVRFERQEDTSADSKDQRAAEDKYRHFAVASLGEYDSVERLRAELFGWKKGSFTSALEDFEGLLGKANGGTLFLDEVHHLPKSLQAALLRPLNDGTYLRIGETEPRKSDFDLVTATNRCNDWESYLADDFLDRIKGVVLRVPSFAEVLQADGGFDDLKYIFCYVLNQQCKRSNVKYQEPSEFFWSSFQELLDEYPLPGNWRDLYFLARHLLLYCSDPYEETGMILNWEKTAEIQRALSESLTAHAPDAKLKVHVELSKVKRVLNEVLGLDAWKMEADR